MSEFLDLNHDREFSEEELPTLMEAGTDITRGSLHQCMAGAVPWPEWVERARKRLEEVCEANAESLPDVRDTKDLHLIRGAVKESVRWK